jgi:hypothetical protein
VQTLVDSSLFDEQPLMIIDAQTAQRQQAGQQADDASETVN